MSGLDGLGVLMAVSRGECGVQPTIFTMTGMDAPGITNQLIRAGSAYHFVKPFDPDIIAERVEMMCAPAAGEEAVAAARPAVEVVDLETIVTEIIMEIGIDVYKRQGKGPGFYVRWSGEQYPGQRFFAAPHKPHGPAGG